MIDVVYLAYCNQEIGYDFSIVQNFINSYNHHSAGIKHNLVIVAKNWIDRDLYNQLASLAKMNNADLMELPDDGLDIGAYFRAARNLKSEYVCFLGSNTQIMSDNWLSYMFSAFESDNIIQLVGPMGSWAKGLTDKFPNPHIRTTSFMIKRELFIEYVNTQKFPKAKEDTWLIEHGKNSLSNFISKKGFKFVIVNSDGKIFQPEDWAYSHTYFCMGESKLVLSDKWARKFHTLDELHQIKTAMVEWGKNIEKFPRNFVSDFSSKINIFMTYPDVTDVFSTNVIIPVFFGSEITNLQTDAPHDITVDNIEEKQRLYGELSAYYWILKKYLPTAKTDYIGVCQHYRFLDFNLTLQNNALFAPIYIDNHKANFPIYSEENIMKFIEDYDVILPEKAYLSTSVYENYLITNDKCGFDCMLEVIKECYPDYADEVDNFSASDSMFVFGNFVMKNEIMSEFLNWLFKLLEILDKKSEFIRGVKEPDFVLSYFNSDFIFNVWLNYNIKNKNLKCKTTASYTVYNDFQLFMEKCMSLMQNLQEKAIS